MSGSGGVRGEYEGADGVEERVGEGGTGLEAWAAGRGG